MFRDDYDGSRARLTTDEERSSRAYCEDVKQRGSYEDMGVK